MPANPNNLSRFWHELRRRKVTRVITVYAAAAFAILELTDIVAPSLGLPVWTLNFMIILLCAGFIIAVITSWIYDLHPEGGMVRTKPARKAEEEEGKPHSNSWRVASYISFAVIVALIVLNILPRANSSGKRELLDKSIAVLPFINDSPDEEKMYFINGTMEAILDNLCKIGELRVVSRTSVEQYRDNLKSVQEIAGEMKVSYVLEGSGLKDEGNIRLTIQLIDAIHDRHIWSQTYNRKSSEIFSLQSEIAQLVAAEIQAIVSPREKALIDKEPTSSLTAYDLYQKGRELQLNHLSGPSRRETAATIESLYRRSLQYDSTFAMAYLGLAQICYSNYSWDPLINENMIDSALIYTNLALFHDDQLADAYTFKGYYYRTISETDLALQAWEKALSLSPNAAEPYKAMGWLYNSTGDYVKSIESFKKASSLDRGPELPSILYGLGFELTSIGFYTESTEQYNEKVRLDGDSTYFYQDMAYAEYCAGHYEKAIEAGQQAVSRDPQNSAWSVVGSSYLELKQYEESLYHLKKFEEGLESRGQINFYYLPALAFAYMQNGDTAKSEFYVNEQIILGREWIKRRVSGYEENYMRLAQVYAFTGDKENAIENLRLYNQLGGSSVHITRLRNSPMFENIKEEPEFQQIINELEAKYQAEHERVRQWLEENDML
jgi:TolB-like protein/lipoprotein NlpI